MISDRLLAVFFSGPEDKKRRAGNAGAANRGMVQNEEIETVAFTGRSLLLPMFTVYPREIESELNPIYYERLRMYPHACRISAKTAVAEVFFSLSLLWCPFAISRQGAPTAEDTSQS